MEPIRALFVDDERSLLDGLRRSLHRMAKGWNLEFVESGAKALERLEHQSFDVVITDMRMPGMNGVELLTEVRKLYPKIVRFILSGYSDKGMILKSVGLCHQFFAKPCDPEHLFHAIHFSTSLYKHLGSEKIQKVICGLRNLPTPPMTYTKMSAELNKSEPSMELLSEMVTQDSAVSARVLQAVNSAFFGIGRAIDDIQQATMFLGVENLRSLVLIFGISQESFQSIQHHFDLDLYTQHSIDVGHTAQWIAKELEWNRKDRQSAFTAGLLHDIGKLVMATHFESNYSQQREFSMLAPDTESFQELEEQRFGINHAEIGAALIGLWGLPPRIVNAVAYHHKPDHDIVEGISHSVLVHMANALVLLKNSNSMQGEVKMHDLLNVELLRKLGLEAQFNRWQISGDFS